MRLQVPDTLPRLFPVKRWSGRGSKDGKISYHHYLIWLEQIIAANLFEVFPDMKVIGAHPFRIIRDAALQGNGLEMDEPFESMEQSIQQLSIQRREFGAVIRGSHL